MFHADIFDVFLWCRFAEGGDWGWLVLILVIDGGEKGMLKGG